MHDEELDALCATKVMGWNYKPGVEGRWYEYDNLVATEDWSPTRDITDAWQVLEAVQAMPDVTRVSIDHFTDTSLWACVIETDSKEYERCRETASKAIVLACLLFVEGLPDAR